jgi:hypothetical protein
MPDRIDQLTADLDSLIRKIDRTLDADLAKRKQTFHLEHDDGNGDGDYADASNPSMDAADDYDDDGYDEYDEEDDGTIEKATINAAQMRNDPSNRPGDLATSTHPSSDNARHKFVALTEKIANDQGIPKSQAMALARTQYPDVYANYVGAAGYSKRAPTTFEDYVNAEMAKGCSYEVAAQRVAQLRGFPALDHRNLAKSEATAIIAEDKLMKAANNVWENSNLDRCESLREARKSNPSLYRRMNR